jgi:hypothetical protein
MASGNCHKRTDVRPQKNSVMSPIISKYGFVNISGAEPINIVLISREEIVQRSPKSEQIRNFCRQMSGREAQDDDE